MAVLADLCCTCCLGDRLLERLLAIPDLASMGGHLCLQQRTQASCLHPHCYAGDLPQERQAPVAGKVGMPQHCWGCSMRLHLLSFQGAAFPV